MKGGGGLVGGGGTVESLSGVKRRAVGAGGGSCDALPLFRTDFGSAPRAGCSGVALLCQEWLLWLHLSAISLMRGEGLT